MALDRPGAPLALSVGGNASIRGAHTTAGNVAVAGDPMLTGNQTLTGTLVFGVKTRQMVNLFDTTYGIGVQSAAIYLRTDNDFFWYRGGRQGGEGGGTLL